MFIKMNPMNFPYLNQYADQYISWWPPFINTLIPRGVRISLTIIITIIRLHANSVSLPHVMHYYAVRYMDSIIQESVL